MLSSLFLGQTNMKGETPLHVAAISGDMDHVVKLVEVLVSPCLSLDAVSVLRTVTL